LTSEIVLRDPRTDQPCSAQGVEIVRCSNWRFGCASKMQASSVIAVGDPFVSGKP